MPQQKINVEDFASELFLLPKCFEVVIFKHAAIFFHEIKFSCGVLIKSGKAAVYSTQFEYAKYKTEENSSQLSEEILVYY